MVGKRKGIIIVAFAVVAVVTIGVVGRLIWREIAVEYHLYRLRREPGYLGQAIGLQQGDARRVATSRYLKTQNGKRVLFDLYVDGEIEVREETVEWEVIVKYLRTREGREVLQGAFIKAVVEVQNGFAENRAIKQLIDASMRRRGYISFFVENTEFVVFRDDVGLKLIYEIERDWILYRLFPFRRQLETGTIDVREYPNLQITISKEEGWEKPKGGILFTTRQREIDR